MWRVFLLEPKPICGEVYVRGVVVGEWVADGREGYMIFRGMVVVTYRGHNSLALKASADTVVNAFRFPPVAGYAFEAVGLVAIERVSPCIDFP